MRSASAILGLAAATVVALGIHGSAAAAPPAARAAVAPTNLTAPRVLGTLQPRHTLVASAGSWSGVLPMRLKLQWFRCAVAGAPCRAVRGATGTRYRVTTGDAGHRLRIKVAVANAHGSAFVRSAPTGRIRAAARPQAGPAQKPAAPKGGSGAAPFFVDRFDPGSLAKWNKEGDAGSFAVVTSLGSKAASLGVGPGYYGPNNSSNMAALWLSSKPWTGANGQDVWYRTRVNFPSDYRPTKGEWNIFYEWHNDNATHNDAAGAYSPIYRVNTWSGQERLEMRWMGGVTTSPTTTIAVGPVLQRNHAYDFLTHVVWSPDASTGRVDWFLDGQLLFSKNLATLYRRRDGGVSHNIFGLYNYRLAAGWDASIQFDDVLIGPSRASVSG